MANVDSVVTVSQVPRLDGSVGGRNGVHPTVSGSNVGGRGVSGSALG